MQLPNLDQPINEWFPEYEGYDMCEEWTKTIESGASLNTCPSKQEALVWYAKHVIKGRWPEAEPAIMVSPGYAYAYAIRIIKGRWPEAEPIISTDKRAFSMYTRFVSLLETNNAPV